MKRTDLSGLHTFLTIAKHGSLSAAARALDVKTPAVSHQLKVFEGRMGVKLFVRTTRSLTLTDAGQRLHDNSSHLVAALQNTMSSIRNSSNDLSGQLRITLPYRSWQLIVAPRLEAFTTSYPDIELDLSIDEALTDIVSESFHCGIRLGDHLDANMVAVRLSTVEECAYIAAPTYLQRHGIPERPHDLLEHHCIRYRQNSTGEIAQWSFTSDGGDITVAVDGKLVLNDLRTVVDAAKSGAGIAWSLKRGVQQELHCGSLVQVLANYTQPRPGFHLYFPKELKQLSILRAFIDHFRIS